MTARTSPTLIETPERLDGEPTYAWGTDIRPPINDERIVVLSVAPAGTHPAAPDRVAYVSFRIGGVVTLEGFSLHKREDGRWRLKVPFGVRRGLIDFAGVYGHAAMRDAAVAAWEAASA